MQKIICTRCKKNIAVIFITKVENGKTSHDGICLKCARELGIEPVNDIIQKMGLTDQDLENINENMLDMVENGEESMPTADDNLIEGNTTTFPFLDKLFGTMHLPPEQMPLPRPKEEKSGKKEADQKAPPRRKFLESYCVCLNEKAVNGKIDNIIGREVEIERVVQILNRRQKNNPCLIGEPGVGKTAIAEGLALRITGGGVPVKLQDKEVWLLDLTAMVAGTQFRGQFESRMKGLIDEIKKLGNIILVIDEVHNIVGAGDAEGSMNAANILKPALSRGDVQVIGATTFAEYRKYIEKDAALERRFQPVTVDEPSVEQSVEILKGIRKYYESFHLVTISDDICREAVALSERYITDRYLPDKAIDLIDEASSSVNLHNAALAEIVPIRKQLADIEIERGALTAVEPNEQNYARLAELKSHELQLSGQLNKITDTHPAVTSEDLARVIELWTKIPASRVCEKEFERISHLEERIKERIVGQDEAIASVAAAIRRSRAGISYKRKPVSFIFAGPTGVGKTELVRRLALDLFDTPESLIRLDMSEFMEKHSVSRIIGSPPGYVGYDEAGQLTEKIRRKPYSVVLFDEIEKAHPDVLNILLQILDDGRITDAHGRQVSFENTLIVMTTNAGSDRNSGTPGFGRSVSEQGKDKTMKALTDIMRPEFLNRIDEIITFNSLSEDNFSHIAEIMLNDLKSVLTGKGIRFEYDDKLVAYLTAKSYSIRFGARNLRRQIQKEVEDQAAAAIIASYSKPVTIISATAEDGHVIINAA